jgi:hypothetical protein
MQVKAKMNFSFAKLANNAKDIIDDFREESINIEAEAMKERISSSTDVKGKKFDPIKNSTVLVRSIRNQSMNNPPLNATGRLAKSITPLKSGIRMKGYGIYHNEGYTPRNIPAFLGKQAIKKSNRSIKFIKNSKNIRVPKRQFAHTETTYGIDKELLGKFYNRINKNLKK